MRARRAAGTAGWLAVAAWMALIFLLSAQPGLRLSEDAAVDAPARALAHMAVYGILGALLLHALGASRAGRSTRRAAALAVGLAVLYGVSDEIHQSFVPDRSARATDLLLDAIGAVLGVALAAGLVWLRSRSRAASA